MFFATIQGSYTGPTGNPATANSTAIYLAGLLGSALDFGGRKYVWVQLSATGVTPVAGQVLYWKDKTNFVVTNKASEALAGGTTNGWRNMAAGILINGSATLGNFVCMCVAGLNISIVSDGTGAVGDILTAGATSTQATSVSAASATYVAASAVFEWGVIRVAPAAGIVVGDINFLGLP